MMIPSRGEELSSGRGSTLSATGIIAVAVGAWKAFLLAFAVAIALAAAWQWMRPWYVSQAVLQPVSADVSSLSRMAGLAAQFGIAVPTGGSNQSVDFYARLATSREVLEAVVKANYRAKDQLDSASLLEQAAGGEEPGDELLRDVVQWLRDNSRMSIDVTAGLLTIQVGAGDSELAEQINRKIITQIEQYNARTVQALAGAEREFLESRVQEVAEELRMAENELRAFLQRNRTYEASPELTLEAARLQRRVDREHQLFLSLSQARDQARIEEARNTPVITLVEAPEGSSEPAKFGKRLALALAASLILTAFVVFGRVLAATPSAIEARQTILGSLRQR